MVQIAPEKTRRWWTLGAACLAAFMTTLDNTVVNVAIPSIQRDLHLSVAGLEWVVASYLLAYGSLMLVGGQLADLYGRRRLFLIGLTIFTTASLSCGLARDESFLVGSRIAQGVGAAVLTPTALATVAATFAGRERSIAIGIWTAVTSAAYAIGPLAGGFISQHLPSGWIFFINVPAGMLDLAVCVLVVAESRQQAERRRLDLGGLVTSAFALLGLTFALVEGHTSGWGSPLIVGAFALAGVTGSLFVMLERRVRLPMVELGFFRNRVFSGATLVQAVWGFAVMGVYFYSSLFIQQVLGFSPTEAGLAFVPLAIAAIVAAVVSARVAAVAGVAWTVAASLVVVAGGLGIVALVGEGSRLADLLPGLIMIGVGSGLMAPVNDVQVSALPQARAGLASSVLNTSRELAGLFGVTVMGAILTGRQGQAIADGATPGQAFLQGYELALVTAAAIVMIGAVVGAQLLPRNPAKPEVDEPNPLAVST
jgi:EmrB/QacA subfamily drug resistance transporter